MAGVDSTVVRRHLPRRAHARAGGRALRRALRRERARTLLPDEDAPARDDRARRRPRREHLRSREQASRRRPVRLQQYESRARVVTRTWVKDLNASGIRVNSVAPGALVTGGVVGTIGQEAIEAIKQETASSAAPRDPARSPRRWLSSRHRWPNYPAARAECRMVWAYGALGVDVAAVPARRYCASKVAISAYAGPRPLVSNPCMAMN